MGETAIDFLRIVNVFSNALLALAVILMIMSGFRYVITNGEFGKDGIAYSGIMVFVSFIIGVTSSVILIANPKAGAGTCHACQVESGIIFDIYLTTLVVGIIVFWLLETSGGGKEDEEIQKETELEEERGVQQTNVATLLVPTVPVNSRVTALYESILDAIKSLELHLGSLDVESRYRAEESLHKDATNLYASYIGLNEEQQLRFEEVVMLGFNEIQNQIEEIKQKADGTNAKELEKVLLVIKNKYAKV